MKMLSEFKEFAVKGNVVDMAVGVIIGGVFGKIVSSFVDDIIMPPIGMLLGGADFKSLKIVLKEAFVDGAGVEQVAVAINYGNFIQIVLDFLIIAFSIFLVVRGINRLKRKQKEEIASEPPAPSKEEVLLTEIRDILKNK